jgi:hypothetical protein
MIRSSMVAVVAALAAAVPSAQATARTQVSEVTAGPTEVVDGPGSVEGHAGPMVVDRFGTATMVWDRANGGRYAAQRSPAGVWSTPQLIGCPQPYTCGEAHLGVDDTGTVSAAWDLLTGRPEVVVASKAPAAAWSTPVTLTTGRGREHGYEPRLAVAPNGAAVVSWLNGGGTSSFVARKPAGASWASTTTKHLRQFTEEVAIAADGTVLVAGVDSADGPGHAVVKVFRPTRGWQPTVVLGRAGGGQTYTFVAVGPGHRAAAVWTTGPRMKISPSAVLVRRTNRRYHWAAAERISPWLGDNATPFVSGVLVEARGRVTVMWHGRTDKATTRLPGGRWVSRRVMPTSGALAVRGLSTDQAGALAVPWTVEHYDEAAGKFTEEVHVSLRPAGALDWIASPTLDVTYGGTSERGDPGYRPFSVGVLPDGSALVSWFDLTNALVAEVVR